MHAVAFETEKVQIRSENDFKFTNKNNQSIRELVQADNITVRYQ